MARNKSNRPLMIYTSLIFIVAIIMVVVAFFGQRHLESAQFRQTETAKGISVRASQLSEENRLLMEVNKRLTNSLNELTEENQTLQADLEVLSKESEQNKKLTEVYIALNNSGRSKARKLLKEIYTEDLTAEQKDFYDMLAKKCN
ncbi:MAG: hypothetical protein IJ423_05180 [Clostridia bacterium]|nr:hypothetical protein [Clostridia bacterium]MBQ8637362.1 hypothetical protein [Clostridia bacterium]